MLLALGVLMFAAQGSEHNSSEDAPADDVCPDQDFDPIPSCPPNDWNSTATYELYHVYDNNSLRANFTQDWTWYIGTDPTGGPTFYGPHEDLLIINNGSFTIKVDDTEDGWTSRGRRSVRIQTTESFLGGLFIFDIDHLPRSCGTWPAVWFTGDDWPQRGEYDMIEYLMDAYAFNTALHTGRIGSGRCVARCNRSMDLMLSNYSHTACDDAPAPNVGCNTMIENSTASSINEQGGGVWVVEWDSQRFIKTWYFPRGMAPDGLTTNDTVTLESLGMPLTTFPFGADCTPYHFRQMRLVINIAVCGDWFNSVWSQGCPTVAHKYGSGECNAYARAEPKAFSHAFWTFRQIRVLKVTGPPIVLPDAWSCHLTDYEYGNLDQGSCAWATLVGLHCGQVCLDIARESHIINDAMAVRQVVYQNASLCQEACQATEGCEFWVFSLNPGYYLHSCWLKKSITCDPSLGSSIGFVTGPRECPVPSATKLYPNETCTETDFDTKTLCTVPYNSSDADLSNIVFRNCRKVKLSMAYLQKRIDTGKVPRPISFYFLQAPGWLEPVVKRVLYAKAMCFEADMKLKSGDLHEAAMLAANAWGEVLMDNRECCVLARAPFCEKSTFVNATGQYYLFSILILTIPCVLCFRSPADSDEGELDRWFFNSGKRDPGSCPWTGICGLDSELGTIWDSSPLSNLPGDTPAWKESTVRLFVALGEAYGFQQDSVRNQFEHFLSLWRSHCAILKDRDGATDDTRLLSRGLDMLHSDLLQEFCSWRDNLPGREVKSGRPRLRGVVVGKPATHTLAEVSMYLLVWGEAGNLRLTPHVVFLLVELALFADPVPRGSTPGDVCADSHFLDCIVRPIYMAFFEEWCDRVEGKQGEDIRVMKASCNAFLPPECANYDDWNELLSTANAEAEARLARTLVLKGGSALFHLDHTQRFEKLPEVDWKASLSGRKAKTHREVHSFLSAWASTHRIWFLHIVLYMITVFAVYTDIMPGVHLERKAPYYPDVLDFNHTHETHREEAIWMPEIVEDDTPVQGSNGWVVFSGISLVVPIHGTAWLYQRWALKGTAAFPGRFYFLFESAACALPLVTFPFVRRLDHGGDIGGVGLRGWLYLHLVTSFTGFMAILFAPASKADKMWTLAPVAIWKRSVRWLFWIVLLSLKVFVDAKEVARTLTAVDNLRITQPLNESFAELWRLLFSAQFNCDLIIWTVIWVGGLLVYFADTQLWFTIACSILGSLVQLCSRNCNVFKIAFEDSISKLPRRFVSKVLTHDQRMCNFRLLWDRVVEHFLFEDKLDIIQAGDLSFNQARTGMVTQSALWNPPPNRHTPADTFDEASFVRTVSPVFGSMYLPERAYPAIFRTVSYLDRNLRREGGMMEDPTWPTNEDVQWRLRTLAQNLGLKMPRPYQVPYIPGLTVLIPHYQDEILLSKKMLFNRQDSQETRGQIVPLISWLEARYPDEFRLFHHRNMAESPGTWTRSGRQWANYTDAQWTELCKWASMRSQTLWRTVVGMCLYHSALDCHFTLQGDTKSAFGRAWDPRHCFTVLVSMQLYATSYFDSENGELIQQTNLLLEECPPCLQIAYIDHEELKVAPTHMQKLRHDRRYFSCVFDASCPSMDDGRRKPRLRIELPGYPVLGDGKGDNQNHAIIFSRGTLIQCVDANQGAYFEQMLLLPCLLAEFRENPRQIIGFPEKITSDIGSIGNFGASAEFAFGTILQRAYAALGVRMHYGHPDIMSKASAMNLGGVSKATKTLNITEDIFTGMEFMLRGGGVNRHCGYFHLAKGRDLGFNTLLKFFSKVASGNAEQLISRQAHRLCHLLPLPDFLSFFYAHWGFFITQCFVTWSTPLLAFTYLFIVLNDCEKLFPVFDSCEQLSGPRADAVEIVVGLTSFSRLIFFYLLAQALPIFTELWATIGLYAACRHFVVQLFTLSPVYFIFQSKIVTSYLTKELRHGGATYIATGRGLPTERRPFIGSISQGRICDGPFRPGGLYLDYADHAFYDGMALLATALLSWYETADRVSGASLCWQAQLWLTVVSWIFAPFLFNPYQFSARYVLGDLYGWIRFFWVDSGAEWLKWYRQGFSKYGDKPMIGPLVHDVLISAVWFSILEEKLHVLAVIFPTFPFNHYLVFEVLALSPPFLLSMMLCSGCCWCSCCRCCCKRRRRPSRDLDDVATPERGLPLFAIGVLACGIVETLVPMYWLWIMGWNKTLIAGLVLKGYLLSWLMNCVENLFLAQANWARRIQASCFGRMLRLWIHAHRLCGDMLVSSCIFIAMLPVVLLSTMNDCLCQGISVHSLLIYRRTSGPQRFSMKGGYLSEPFI